MLAYSLSSSFKANEIRTYQTALDFKGTDATLLAPNPMLFCPAGGANNDF